MRYYCVINKEAYMKAINRFIVRQSETGNIFLLSFEDSDLEYIEKNSEKYIILKMGKPFTAAIS